VIIPPTRRSINQLVFLVLVANKEPSRMFDTVISIIKLFYNATLHILRLGEEFRKLLQRATSPPGLPVAHPTKSYWLEDPPFPELTNIQSAKLPRTADIVIIGSGITGAGVARAVFQECRRKKETRHVVVLEAREICSGATGRNGGHMKSSPHELFSGLNESMGPERAAALTRFQLAHVKTMVELCQAEGWDTAECREVETADVYLDDECRDKAFREVELVKKWIPELEIEVLDATAAQKVSDVLPMSCIIETKGSRNST
jgi:hypothetical protein